MRQRRQSILRQATVIVVAIELLGGVGFTGTAVWHEWELRERGRDATLAGRMNALIGAVQDAETPADDLMLDPEEFTPRGGDEYAVYDDRHKLVGSSARGGQLEVRPRRHAMTERVGGERYRVMERDAVRVIDRNEHGSAGIRRGVTVVYGVPAGRDWLEAVEATQFYVFLSLVQIGVTAVVLVVGLRRLLAPMRALASRAEGIGGRLEFEAPEEALRVVELAPLAEALRGAMERVRATFETERRFMSDAAHELKTAVAVVRSSAQVVGMRERTGAEYRAGLERVLEDTGRLEALVAEMLLVGRVEEKAEAVGQRAELAGCVERVVERTGSVAAARGVRVGVERCGESSELTVGVKEELVEVVVGNLVMNGVQHSRSGGEVVVRLGELEDGWVRLEVVDTGEGISGESLPHVFERFYRADSSRTRETGGAGLGLAICRSVVESAGGRIWLESEVGVGTRAVVELPRA